MTATMKMPLRVFTEKPISTYVFDAIEFLPGKANSYVRDLAKLKAYEQDPQFRRIEDRRHATLSGNTVLFSGSLSIEDWMYQVRKIEDLTPSLELWSKFYNASTRPRVKWRQLRHALQRARDGYDAWAVNDFRSWHSTIVLRVLKEYRSNMHGHPPDRSMQQWKQDIDTLIQKFEVLAEDHYDQPIVDDAMKQFAKVYLHLWD